jgi:hypothetical protein
MIRNGKVVNRTLVDGKFLAPFKADVSVNFESQKRPSERTGRSQIQDIGDLSDIGSLQEVDATGYVVTVADGVLRQGAEAALLFYRESRATEIAWDARDLESRFPPDAVFRSVERQDIPNGKRNDTSSNPSAGAQSLGQCSRCTRALVSGERVSTRDGEITVPPTLLRDTSWQWTTFARANLFQVRRTYRAGRIRYCRGRLDSHS